MTITPPKLKKGGQLAVRVDCELSMFVLFLSECVFINRGRSDIR